MFWLGWQTVVDRDIVQNLRRVTFCPGRIWRSDRSGMVPTAGPSCSPKPDLYPVDSSGWQVEESQANDGVYDQELCSLQPVGLTIQGDQGGDEHGRHQGD